jgi:hypothetical protein
MSSLGKTLTGYFWWTYERGSLHYDVMVTLILLFVFLAPRFIDFRDKPTEHNPHPTGVIVNPDGQGGLFYQVDASAVAGKSGAELESALLRVIEPVSGEVTLLDYQPVKDGKGRVTSYLVRAQR